MTYQSYFCLITFILLGFSETQANILRYTFRVNYTSGYPDGVWTTHILGINGRFPGPTIIADVGDTLQITVINSIYDGQNLSIHWHGIHQSGTPFEDGPVGITQCPIKYGRSQTYTFQVPLAGTYWYHSHVNSQYTEGLWGLLIVRAKPEIYQNQYDDEIIITLNDWYHTSALENEQWLLSSESEGAPPYPSSALMNGVGRFPCSVALTTGYLCLSSRQQRPVFRVQPGKTYRLRLVNTAGWTAFNFTVEGHTLRAIEVDGVDTILGEPVQAVYIAAGQRYSFLLSIPHYGLVGNRFLIRASVRTEFLYRRPRNINTFPDSLFQEVTGVLVYSSISSLNKQSLEPFDDTNSYTVSSANAWQNLEFLDELSLTPYDRIPAPRNFSKSLQLDILFTESSQGIRHGSFNSRPAEVTTGIPQLALMMQGNTIPHSYFPVYVPYGEIVQVVINNPELGPHPMHLHGHHFWVMGMGREGEGNYNPMQHALSYNGCKRDTVVVKQKSWLVIRFRTDNVGVWTLHCHVDWHMLTGMMMTFIEASERANTLWIPSEARRVCADHNIFI